MSRYVIITCAAPLAVFTQREAYLRDVKFRAFAGEAVLDVVASTDDSSASTDGSESPIDGFETRHVVKAEV